VRRIHHLACDSIQIRRNGLDWCLVALTTHVSPSDNEALIE
jgi:hypothetical protein